MMIRGRERKEKLKKKRGKKRIICEVPGNKTNQGRMLCERCQKSKGSSLNLLQAQIQQNKAEKSHNPVAKGRGKK